MSITRNGYTLTQATDAAGHYSFVAGAGTYEVKAEAFGYSAQTVSAVSVTQNATTTQDFALSSLTTGSISGDVLESVDPPNDPPKRHPGRDPGVLARLCRHLRPPPRRMARIIWPACPPVSRPCGCARPAMRP